MPTSPNQPLVSIIMPVKNAMPFLNACIESIKSQTYTHWELIAVDDHSEDQSYKLLNQLSVNDSRITVVKNENNGIIAALRTAYARTKGMYITRMDADDIMAHHKIQTLLEVLLANKNIQVSVGLVAYFNDECPLGEGYKKYQDWLNQLSTNRTYWQEIYKECVIPSPAWMMSKKDLDQINAFQPNQYPEDYDLCFRMYQYHLQVAGTKKIVHYWRDYNNRTSRTHENYKDNRFLDLKCHYFLKLDYDKTATLCLWGAGKKAKRIAQLLTENNINFRWTCNNPNKIGHKIYETIIEKNEIIFEQSRPQLIIAVASPDQQNKIRSKLIKHPNIDRNKVHFFC